VQDYRFNWNGYRDMDRRTLLLDGELSPPRLRASTAALDAILSNSRVVVLHGQRGQIYKPSQLSKTMISRERLNLR
jgi:hypothetical protein